MKKEASKSTKWRRLLCAALAVAMLSGCSGKGGDVNANLDNTEIPESLRIFSPIGGKAVQQGAKSNNDLIPFQLMEEWTGCHVDWIHPSGTSLDESFTLMFASGDLPDMIVWGWLTTTGGVESYLDEGVIVPLTDYIDKYMPNLKAFNEERPDIKQEYTLDDGTVCFIPFIRKDDLLKVYAGPLIRTDWLEKLNLEVPTNSEELYTVLKAFKTQDPNGNGEADELPITAIGFEERRRGLGALTWSFGAPYDFYLQNNEVHYGVLDNTFYEGLKFITKLYSEGMIDPDYLLNDVSQMTSKVLNDKVGFMYGFQPSSFYSNKNYDEWKMDGIPHLKNADGVAYGFHSDYRNNTVTNRAIAMTNANKNPVGSMKWLDCFFSKQGVEYMNFGKEGVSFEWEGDYPRLIGPALDTTQNYLYLGAYENTFPTLQDWRYYEQVINPVGREAIVKWKDSADISGIMPNLLFTAEEREKITDTMAQVDTYALEAINRIIIGNESIENFKDVRERIKSMGIEDVLKIYNDAYNRYQNR